MIPPNESENTSHNFWNILYLEYHLGIRFEVLVGAVIHIHLYHLVVHGLNEPCEEPD